MPPSDPLHRELAALANISRRARLRALMPTIAALISAGVTRQAVVDKLAAEGLPITLAGLKSALRRWRAQGQPGSVTSAPASPQVAMPATPSASGTLAHIPTAAVSNKGDLARLRRSSSPDLNELARIGKQQQRS